MKVSAKCRYGLSAMVEIARHYHNGPVKRKSICKGRGMSNAYLENVIIALKKDHLLTTTRGANGGVKLEQEPAEISMLQIVKALEGSIAPVECLENNTCEKTAMCGSLKAWKMLFDAEVKTLESISLQDLLDMEQDETPSYSI